MGRWRVFCRRLESRVKAPSLKRLVLWVGENPLPAVVGTVAVSWTAATIASALALQLAFSMLSVVLPVVFFATVGVPAMLVFGGVLVFGVLLPAASFALFAVGGSVLATISTVLPIVAFLGAVALGSNLVDVLLPNEVEEEDDINKKVVLPYCINPPDKEHLNLVFVGHVDAGKSKFLTMVVGVELKSLWSSSHVRCDPNFDQIFKKGDNP